MGDDFVSDVAVDHGVEAREPTEERFGSWSFGSNTDHAKDQTCPLDKKRAKNQNTSNTTVKSKA